MNKEREIIGSTTKCIVCLKKAVVHSGHVRKGDKEVIAGWCEEHRELIIVPYVNRSTKGVYLLKSQGCFGGFHESYGFEAESKSITATEVNERK